MRAKISKTVKWKFEKSLSDYDVPKELGTFIKWIVIGTKSQITGGECEVENTISSKVIGQLVMNSFKTDRQVSYKPLSNEVTYRQRNETSIALGLSLMVHNVTRSRILVTFLSQINLGSSYSAVMNQEKRIAAAVTERIEQTGGVFVPPFLKTGKQPFIAFDNIDFMECTPDGQNTLHGTIIFVSQDNKTDGIPVGEQLVIPKKAKNISLPIANTDAPRLLSPKKIVTFSKYVFGSDEEIIAEYQSGQNMVFCVFFCINIYSHHCFQKAIRNIKKKRQAMTHLLVTDERVCQHGQLLI